MLIELIMYLVRTSATCLDSVSRVEAWAVFTYFSDLIYLSQARTIDHPVLVQSDSLHQVSHVSTIVHWPPGAQLFDTAQDAEVRFPRPDCPECSIRLYEGMRHACFFHAYGKSSLRTQSGDTCQPVTLRRARWSRVTSGTTAIAELITLLE